MPRIAIGSEWQHRDTQINRSMNKGNGKYSLGVEETRPATPTIYNTVVNTNNWTAIASGLTDVLAWVLNEQAGQEFDYCFDGIGTTYMTSLGAPVEEDTDISVIYVKRRSAVTLNMQLECWQS